jgi:ABC-2 type transport system permease protein
MGKKFRYRATSTLDILLIAGILVLINIYSLGSFKRHDLTEHKEYTVSMATKKILSQLDDIVNIKVFLSEEHPPQMIQIVRDAKDMLSEFETYANQNFKLKYVDPKGKPELEQEAQMADIPVLSVNVTEKDKKTVVNVYFGIKIEHGNKVESIQFIQPETLEYDLMTKIVKVLQQESKTPTFGILQGHGEPGTKPGNVQQNTPAEEMAYFVESLQKKYKAFDVTLDGRSEVPNTVNTLVVVNPGSIPDYQLYAIDQFVMNGGKLLCMIDGMNVPMNLGGEAPQAFDNGITDLLANYGVQINHDFILDKSCVNVPFRTGQYTVKPVNYPFWVKIMRDNFNQESPITSNLESATFQWPSSISFLEDNLKGMNKIVLVKSSKESWLMEKEFNTSPEQDFNIVPSGNQFNLGVLVSGVFTSYFVGKQAPVIPESGKPAGGDKGFIEKSKETEIIVFPTSWLAKNMSWSQRQGLDENQNLVLNAIDYLSRSEELIGIRSRQATNRPIDQKVMDNEVKRNVIRWVNILAVPFITVSFGLLMFILKQGRKRRFEHELRGSN